jgi:hypothetical protein
MPFLLDLCKILLKRTNGPVYFRFYSPHFILIHLVVSFEISQRELRRVLRGHMAFQLSYNDDMSSSDIVKMEIGAGLEGSSRMELVGVGED